MTRHTIHAAVKHYLVELRRASRVFDDAPLNTREYEAAALTLGTAVLRYLRAVDNQDACREILADLRKTRQGQLL